MGDCRAALVASGRSRRWKKSSDLASGAPAREPPFPSSCLPLYRRSVARGNIDSMYETFEHTADLGLRIHAADLDTLFVEAAQALFTAIVEDLATVQPLQRLDIRLEADDHEYLLFDWLKELLYHFDAEHLLLGRFEVQVSGTSLTGCAWGEPLDPARHVLSHEVKAITYHGLRVEPAADGWLAEVIVDI